MLALIGDDMFHKVKSVRPLPDYKLMVQFAEGQTKIYDVKPIMKRFDTFRAFKETPELFYEVKVGIGGYGVIWNDDIDLSCDELFEKGERATNPFDNLMAFGDATEIWGLNESTLRKAISYGRLINGIDVCKFGKQWVITVDAMRREYGEPTK